jgi:hypothetical protein
MSKAVQSMALVITTNNERLSSLLIGFAQHHQESTAAITLMRERTAGNPVHKRIRNRP